MSLTSSVLSWLQAGARGKSSRMQFKKLQDQKLALYCCQRSIRSLMMAKTWKWLQIWLAIKPNLKCTQFGKYKKEYEDKIALAEANIDKAIAECNAVVTVHERLSGEKQELSLALSSGGSMVQDIIDKTNRLEGQKNDLQKQVDDTKLRVKNEEDLINGISQAGIKVSADANRLREEIKTLESECEKAEEDKSTKDNQIRTLKEEIAHQEDLIAKLGKEKKGAGEGRQKSEEDIQAMEDRCNHLSKVKGKLEQSLDECEDALEREKKSKGDVEKLKRKVEGDLKLTQEAVPDLERVKSELQQTVMRKEKELSSVGAKIEDEHTLGSKYGKQIKELQGRIEELDEELVIERGSRAKAEKNRTILSRDIEDLGGRLEEAGSNTSTQIELNKRREGELGKLKVDLEESNISHEGTLAAMRSKHNNTMSELGENIDSLNKNKAKAEKDKAGMEHDLMDARAGLDDTKRDRANMEKNCKMSQGLIVESNSKMDELARALNEADSTKKKLQVEAQDLNRQIEETENAIGALGKNKISISTQLEDTKKLADAESRDRASLLTKFKMLSTECENLKMRTDEEAEKKNDALKALSKAQSEIQLWKSKYETEALGRIDELEGGKAKLGSCVMEAEETIDSLNTKIALTEKRAHNFDKVVGEWKCKADDLMAELDACRSESRNYGSEVYRLKASYDETTEQLDVVKRENKNLADEIKDLLDQLGDGGRSIHELDKQRRRLEVEKEELQAALEEAESALESEENKVLRAQLELGQVKQEIDRKIAEKEEEFDNTRKNQARAMDSMQASLECEQRAKAEALRIKKKLEGDINDLEIGVDQANKANNEAQKLIKRYQGQYRDAEISCSEEAKTRAELQGKANMSDRRANALQGEMEESRSLLDSAERGKRQTESEMTKVNSKASAEKRHIEGEVHTMHAEIDQTLMAAKNSEEKAKKAMVDAARLADELRAEQDHTNSQAKAKKALESQMVELDTRFSEAEEHAIRGGRATLAKMESRIRELELELGSVQAHTSENQKGFMRSERKSKELAFQLDEDKKNQERMTQLASALQAKIKTYKKQIEEAEEIAALNLAKFRKAQQEFEESEERAKLAENRLSTNTTFY